MSRANSLKKALRQIVYHMEQGNKLSLNCFVVFIQSLLSYHSKKGGGMYSTFSK